MDLLVLALNFSRVVFSLVTTFPSGGKDKIGSSSSIHFTERNVTFSPNLK